MTDRFSNHTYHDLKAAVADFFMYMSSIEVTIEKVFTLTLGLGEIAAEAVLPNIQSVFRRFDLISSASAKRGDAVDFQNLLGDIREAPRGRSGGGA